MTFEVLHRVQSFRADRVVQGIGENVQRFGLLALDSFAAGDWFDITTYNGGRYVFDLLDVSNGKVFLKGGDFFPRAIETRFLGVTAGKYVDSPLFPYLANHLVQGLNMVFTHPSLDYILTSFLTDNVCAYDVDGKPIDLASRTVYVSPLNN